MSGIYIKGIEMPKSCSVCGLFGEYGCPFIGAVGEALTRGERNEDCPLVEVPPHGRLGDLDAFESIKYELPEGQKAFNRGFHSGVQYVQRLVMDAPTIIPGDEGKA